MFFFCLTVTSATLAILNTKSVAKVYPRNSVLMREGEAKWHKENNMCLCQQVALIVLG